MVHLRPMSLSDCDKAYALWLSISGMGLNDIDDSKDGIARFLMRNDDSSFVATDGDRVVGVILAGDDGRRGCIYHLAVAESHQRQGIGTRLVDKALDALKAKSISKVALVVFSGNEKGNAFWERYGFTVRDDLTYRNLALRALVRMDT